LVFDSVVFLYESLLKTKKIIFLFAIISAQIWLKSL